MKEVKINLGSSSWSGEVWCERKTKITLEVKHNKRISAYGRNDGEAAQYDLHLVFEAAEAAHYRYFPFIFQCVGQDLTAEIGEIQFENERVSLDLRNVELQRNGEINLDLEMEYVEPHHPVDHLTRPYGKIKLCEAVLVRSLRMRTHHRPHVVKLDSSVIDSGHPIFVLGSGRCGTSILTWALGQHPNIGALEETNWLPLTLLGAAAAHKMAARPARNSTALYDVDRTRLLNQVAGGFDQLHRRIIEESATRSYVERLSNTAVDFNPDIQVRRSQWAPKGRWVDGTPLNTSYLPLIAEAFPRASFITIVREPVATIRSYINFRPPGSSRIDVVEAANYWLSAMRAIIQMMNSPEVYRMLIMDYSEMASDPYEALRRCFFFLDEPNFGRSAETFKTKINSSYSHDAVHDEVDTQHESVQACLAMYEQFRSGIEVDCPGKTREDYRHWENDVITRIMNCIS